VRRCDVNVTQICRDITGDEVILDCTRIEIEIHFWLIFGGGKNVAISKGLIITTSMADIPWDL
jgi:hypothetical protein